MTKETKPRAISARLEQSIRDLPRCSTCNQLLVATCDRSKPSELVEFKGIEWTKKKPQFMWMFPTADEQSKLCLYCKDRLHPVKVGKES